MAIKGVMIALRNERRLDKVESISINGGFNARSVGVDFKQLNISATSFCIRQLENYQHLNLSQLFNVLAYNSTALNTLSTRSLVQLKQLCQPVNKIKLLVRRQCTAG